MGRIGRSLYKASNHHHHAHRLRHLDEPNGVGEDDEDGLSITIPLEPACTGYQRRVLDLPCSHNILQLLRDGGVLQMDDIGPHWHLDHQFERFDALAALRDRPVDQAEPARPMLQERTFWSLCMSLPDVGGRTGHQRNQA
jgi:hypothetical protein